MKDNKQTKSKREMSSIVLCNKSFRRRECFAQDDNVISRDDGIQQHAKDDDPRRDDFLNRYNNVKLEDRLPSSQLRGHALYRYIPQMIFVEESSPLPLDRDSGRNTNAEEHGEEPSTRTATTDTLSPFGLRPRCCGVAGAAKSKTFFLQQLNQVTALLEEFDDDGYNDHTKNAAGHDSYQTIHLGDRSGGEDLFSCYPNHERQEIMTVPAISSDNGEKSSWTFQEDDTWLEFCDDLPLPDEQAS